VSLMSGAAPGLAVHAHVVVPETVRAIRAKRLAASRGVIRMGLVQGLGIAAIVGVCLAPVMTRPTTERPAMVVEGCGFFNSSGGAQTVQSASAIGACVILQVMGGVTNVDSVIQACGNVLSSQLVSEIDAIIAYYTQPPVVDGGATAPDAGPVVVSAAAPMLCGTGTPPVANAPTCMPLSVISMLKYLRVAAAARANDAGAAASAH